MKETFETVATVKRRLAPKKVEIDGETYYVAEGDQLLDEDELPLYVEQLNIREQQKKLHSDQAALGEAGVGGAVKQLIGMTGADGKLIRWRDGKILTYCVLKNTFADDEEYLLARQSVEKATKAWQDTCGIEFRHVVTKDTSPTTQVKGVVFTVRKIDALGRFIASAFFPNDPPARRRVLIDPSFFSKDLGFDRVGVLRHELGHVLGFRHEHISADAPAACPDEDLTDTKPLTGYDPKSVMHYFCGNVGSLELLISTIDADGAQKIYGQPLSSFIFVD
jgi:hypothetical protein